MKPLKWRHVQPVESCKAISRDAGTFAQLLIAAQQDMPIECA
jgi:hypothetical protein